HLRGEVLHDDERDVSIQKSATNLADSAVDVGRAELSLRAKVAEGLGEPIGERAKSSHGALDSTRVEPRRSAPNEAAVSHVESVNLSASPRQVMDTRERLVKQHLRCAASRAAFCPDTQRRQHRRRICGSEDVSGDGTDTRASRGIRYRA